MTFTLGDMLLAALAGGVLGAILMALLVAFAWLSEMGRGGKVTRPGGWRG